MSYELLCLVMSYELLCLVMSLVLVTKLYNIKSSIIDKSNLIKLRVWLDFFFIIKNKKKLFI